MYIYIYFIYLPTNLPIYSSIYVSIYLSIYLSVYVCMYVCMYACMYISPLPRSLDTRTSCKPNLITAEPEKPHNGCPYVKSQEPFFRNSCIVTLINALLQ